MYPTRIPDQVLFQAQAIIGQPLMHTSDQRRTIVQFPPARKTPQSLNKIILEINPKIAKLGIILRKPLKADKQQHPTAEIVYTWETYIKHLPKHRNTQMGKWKVRHRKLSNHSVITSYDDLNVSMIMDSPIQTNVYVLQETESSDQEIWMSNSDMELATMRAQVEEASGHVLVAGLGMGIYPKLISMKEEIISVTVLEPDVDIIAITEPKIASEKISVVNMTFEQYCNPSQAIQERYDYCFVDIWPKMGQSYEAEPEVMKTAEPVMKTNSLVRVWCQSINDRARTSVRDIADIQYNTNPIEMTETPCYICCTTPRSDLAGLCIACALEKWSDTPDQNGNPFPIPADLITGAITADMLTKIFGLLTPAPYQAEYATT